MGYIDRVDTAEVLCLFWSGSLHDLDI